MQRESLNKLGVPGIESVKKMAKKYKKESGVSHARALDFIVAIYGFHNWKHYLNSPNVIAGKLGVLEKGGGNE